jgi:acetylornithine deacetylase/succinyl-diaminopimelate desuccinylase-like protein
MVDPVALAQQLIRFDTTNPPGGEGPCVRFVEALLREAGLETRMLARDEERPNLVARLPGARAVPPLLLHGHVDVVSADQPGWTKPPFAGLLEDGCLWGRGALDMKGGLAMILSALLRVAAGDERLPGDVVLAVLSDEETGGDDGAGFLVDEHAELFDGVRYALGEGGGATLELSGLRLYPIVVAEKAYAQVRATVHGPGGHGSLPRAGGTMAALGRLLDRLDGNRLPLRVTPVARLMVESLADRRPELRDLLDEAAHDRRLEQLGTQGLILDATLHNTANPTVVRAGVLANVVPTDASVLLDCRALPGLDMDELLAELREVTGEDVELELINLEEGSGPVADVTLLEELSEVARALDPDAVPVPMLDPGITDARFFARLGIQSYGFLPMKLPDGFNRYALVHGPDERVPVETLTAGANVLYRALPRIMHGQLGAAREGAPLRMRVGA